MDMSDTPMTNDTARRTGPAETIEPGVAHIEIAPGAPTETTGRGQLLLPQSRDEQPLVDVPQLHRGRRGGRAGPPAPAALERIPPARNVHLFLSFGHTFLLPLTPNPLSLKGRGEKSMSLYWGECATGW